MNTLIGVNNLTVVEQPAYGNHAQFLYRLGKMHPNDNFALCNPRRMSIDNMRNFCAKAALEGEFDYIMFIDDDVLIPVLAFDMLVRHLVTKKCDIVSGVTLIRGYPYNPMIFDVGEDKSTKGFVKNYAERADTNGLCFCDAVGFSCCLISVALLRKMTPPYFVTGPGFTEDVYFCVRAKRQFPETLIAADVNCTTAHILGPDIISPENRDIRMAYDEAMNPGIKEHLDPDEDRIKRELDLYAKCGFEVIAQET